MVLQKQDVSEYFNIGFVDDDKTNVPAYFDRFKVIEEHPQVKIKKAYIYERLLNRS